MVSGGRGRFIKSKKALAYSKGFHQQCRASNDILECDVVVGMRIYYRTRRPDLDESLILDLLEDYAYKNDRQVKAKVIIHDLDKDRPRTDIVVAPLSETKAVFDWITRGDL